MALLAAATVLSGAWILVNASKPFLVDDTFFLLWARTIHPLAGERPVEPLGWEYYGETMHHQCENYTPGWGLLVATARRWTGDRETALHWLQWPFAVLYLAGAGLLAGAFGAPPWTVFVLCASGPLFLVPCASLMADLACLGPAVFGLALWIGARGWTARIAAALLLALSGQMKPTVLALLPLLVLERDLRPSRKPGVWILAATTALAAGWYPRVPPNLGDDNGLVAHLTGILAGAGSNPGRWARFPAETRLRFGYALATVASLLVCPLALGWAALARPAAASASARVKLLAAAVAGILALSAAGCWKEFAVSAGRTAAVPGTNGTLAFYLALAAAGAWLWTARDAWARPPVRWLSAWIALAVLGFLVGTPFPAARFLVGVAPPFAALFMLDVGSVLPRVTARWVTAAAVAGNLWLGASLARADFGFAEASREAAARGARLAAERRLPLVTTGSWGLRFYVERAGGRLLMSATDRLPEGAMLLVPATTNHWVLAKALRPRCRVRATWTFASRLGTGWLPVRTVPPPGTAASFHGGQFWFPFAFSRAPLDTIRAVEVLPERGRPAPSR